MLKFSARSKVRPCHPPARLNSTQQSLLPKVWQRLHTPDARGPLPELNPVRCVSNARQVGWIQRCSLYCNSMTFLFKSLPGTFSLGSVEVESSKSYPRSLITWIVSKLTLSPVNPAPHVARRDACRCDESAGLHLAPRSFHQVSQGLVVRDFVDSSHNSMPSP